MSSPLREIRELTRVRITLMLREPEAIFWMLIFPVILALILSLAFSGDRTQPSRVAVLAGEEGDELAAMLEADDGIELVRLSDESKAERKLLRGSYDAVVIPGEIPEVRYDPERPEGATAKLRVEAIWQKATSPTPLPEMRTETRKETGERYIDFFFPGLLGMNLMGTGVWGVGFAIVDTRRRKLLKRMMVTPMRRSSFLFSFLASRTVFMVIEVAVILGFGLLVFGVPFQGSALLFSLFCLLGTLSFTGLGLLLASRVKTIEGISGVANAALLPMWLLSGIFFSYERFPEVIHPVIRCLPLTAMNDALRAIMLDGTTMLELLPEVGILALWGAVTFLVAVRIFRWE
jgi:ABC-type multidrug transport system permease subunit